MYVRNYVVYVDVFLKCNYVLLGVLSWLLVTIKELNDMLVFRISCTHVYINHDVHMRLNAADLSDNILAKRIHENAP